MPSFHRTARLLVLLLFPAAVTGCKDSPDAPDMDLGDAGRLSPRLILQSTATRVTVADQMRAAIEMQLSGEPLATVMGRDPTQYYRSSQVPDQYQTTSGTRHYIAIDPVGYSIAVESYEYSKTAMNNLSFDSSAGLSLMYGPLINPKGLTGAAALGLLRNRVQALAIASRAGASGMVGPWVVVPAPTDNPLNRLGFPGLWPEFAEFRSFDPTIAPSLEFQRICTATGINGGFGAGYIGSSGRVVASDFECGSNTLHLVDRDAQVEKVLAVDALGLAAWKQALWAINYFQFVHDVKGRGMTTVADADISQVGKPGNTVRASDGDPKSPGDPGTYLGSSDLEGFQGSVMIDEINNKFEFLLSQLTTSEGTTLGGFSSLKAALDYDYQGPLRYFPHSVSVTEQAGTQGAEPQPMQLTIQSGFSQLADLGALLGAAGELFALTDRANLQVGGSPAAQAVFDGDPFPADNGKPDGEATPHDRSLALLKVAFINLDRLHADPNTGVLCDSAKVVKGQVVRDSHVSTVEVAYALGALRLAYRAITSQLTLYSNSVPDRTATAGALDGTSMAGAPEGASVTARIQKLIHAQAALLGSKLVDSAGLAVNGYDLATDQVDSEPTSLDAQAAVVQGLLAAYLATADTQYRARAQAAYEVLEQRFYNPTLRVYRPRIDEDRLFVFTPTRFGVLQGALREAYLHFGTRPGSDVLREQIAARLGRLNKLVLNGWDDYNNNNRVDYPDECAQGDGSLPRGGLQLAERALTGEMGMFRGSPLADFDRDCVGNIAAVKLPAMLAAQLRLIAR